MSVEDISTRTVAAERAEPRELLGPVMFLVAVTVGFAAVGAYLGRNSSSGAGFLAWLGALACLIGLNVAVRRSQQLAMGLLFGVGLLLGFGIGPILSAYASVNPSVLWQSAAATALFVGALGAFGYATKRDLSGLARLLFWALLGLILLGFVLVFVRIPGGDVVYAVLGLVIFGGYVVVDFNRLARTSDHTAAVPIAAGIFLDILNIFLFFLQLFGRRN
jgi:modulator of FtsH protease